MGDEFRHLTVKRGIESCCISASKFVYRSSSKSLKLQYTFRAVEFVNTTHTTRVVILCRHHAIYMASYMFVCFMGLVEFIARNSAAVRRSHAWSEMDDRPDVTSSIELAYRQSDDMSNVCNVCRLSVTFAFSQHIGGRPIWPRFRRMSYLQDSTGYNYGSMLRHWGVRQWLRVCLKGFPLLRKP